MPGQGTPDRSWPRKEEDPCHRPELAVLRSGRGVPPRRRGIAAAHRASFPGPRLRGCRHLPARLPARRGRARVRLRRECGATRGGLAPLRRTGSPAAGRPDRSHRPGARTPPCPSDHISRTRITAFAERDFDRCHRESFYRWHTQKGKPARNAPACYGRISCSFGTRKVSGAPSGRTPSGGVLHSGLLPGRESSRRHGIRRSRVPLHCPKEK